MTMMKSPAEQEHAAAMVVGPKTDAFEPKSFAEATKIAAMVVSIQLGGCKSEADAMARMMMGAQLGLPVMVSIMDLFTIDSSTGPKLGMFATLARALCNQHPACEYLRIVEATADKCVMAIKRRGNPELQMSWTQEDSVRAGLVGRGEAKTDGKSTNNHDKYPLEMKLARCTMRIIRAEIPEALRGMYAREELPEVIEVQGVATVPQAPKRDWKAEAEAIVVEIEAAATDELRKAVRARVKAYAGDGGPNADDLKAHYDRVHPPKAKPNGPAPVAEAQPEAAKQ